MECLFFPTLFPYYGNSLISCFSQVLPIQWVLLHFPVLWEINGKTHAFPTWWDSLFFPCDKYIFTVFTYVYFFQIFIQKSYIYDPVKYW